jgi:nucleoside-diphosphate-sugar epimerase
VKVLVTGGGGFIGRHLVEAQLQKGREVRVLDVDTSSLSHLAGYSNLSVMEGDIRDRCLVEEAVDGVEWVFHLASVHLSVAATDAEYRSVNVEATKNLLMTALEKNVTRFIHCSSVGVYGKIEDSPTNEQAICSPESIYDITKLEGEEQVLRFYQNTGFPVVVVRPAWVYGPGCPRTLKLFRSIKRRKFFMVGSGKALRHGIYVKDMVEGFELCATTGNAVGQIFILADPQPVSVKELVEKIAEILGVVPPRRSVPIWMMNPVCFGLEVGFKSLGKEPPISRRTLNFFTANSSFDISKARRVLGFDPQVKMDEGLRLTHRWFEREATL